MSDTYEDIMDLEHPVSKTHPRMSRLERAAQFSPFSALTGYDAAIKETQRRTDRKIELSEVQLQELDQFFQYVKENIENHPHICITYFQPDERKEGGAYLSVYGTVKKIDEYRQCIMLEDGKAIPFSNIYKMEKGMEE